MRPGDDEIEMKPERDAVMCEWCSSEADNATPAGPLCERCSRDLAEELEGSR